ncbi:hypothetical protein [Pararhizobium sp.]|uniref:hypothetical protein n=1 Tax=Pararhizobium sp. TaxID=1977563 RepID=UPI003D13D267
MMFFKKKPAVIKIIATTTKAMRHTAEIMIKTSKKSDSDGQHRRMLRTVEDNRLL